MPRSCEKRSLRLHDGSGPMNPFDPKYDWAVYGQDVDQTALGSFLEFASSSLLIPTALDECWVLSTHMGSGVRTPVGELVYKAKTYLGKPGEPEAAEELCRMLGERILKHPAMQRAHGIVGVPANPSKEPHNLPELMAERASRILGIPLLNGLITKVEANGNQGSRVRGQACRARRGLRS